MTFVNSKKQGSYRLWKTWKVMEFKNFIFQAWKVMEFNCQSLKVIKMKVFLVVWLLQMTKQGQCTCKIERSN